MGGGRVGNSVAPFNRRVRVFRDSHHKEVVVMKWVCDVCGYEAEGDTPPDECPVCGVDSSHFEEA
jgi:rubrerythrin